MIYGLNKTLSNRFLYEIALDTIYFSDIIHIMQIIMIVIQFIECNMQQHKSDNHKLFLVLFFASFIFLHICYKRLFSHKHF